MTWMSHFAFFSPPSFAFVYLSSFFNAFILWTATKYASAVTFSATVLYDDSSVDYKERIWRINFSGFVDELWHAKACHGSGPNVKLYMPHVFCGSQGKIPQKATLSPSPKELVQNYRFRNCSPIFLATQFCDLFFSNFCPIAPTEVPVNKLCPIKRETVLPISFPTFYSRWRKRGGKEPKKKTAACLSAIASSSQHFIFCNVAFSFSLRLFAPHSFVTKVS